MSDTSLSKAQIVNIDKSGSTPIMCMFNPKEYSFSKTNTWTRDPAAGSNVPQISFGGGQPATLTMELFFDTYGDTQPGQRPEDVRRKYTEAIWSLMMIDKDLQDPKSHIGRPPKVRFQWGTSWSFNAVITSVSQRFTMFLADGTPVRATLNVTFQQIEDETLLPAQNPTSGGVGGERMWTVKDGDSLAWIAYQQYGDSTKWRPIAEANRLTQVRELTPGMVLVIPNV